MIDLQSALAEVRLSMANAPPGSELRRKLMTVATDLTDAIALEDQKPAAKASEGREV